MKKDIDYKNSDNISAKWKAKVRKNPLLTRILQFIFDPAFVRYNRRNNLIDSFPDDAVILNIGSGVKGFSKRCINLDIEPFGNVDIIADAQRLPFKDKSIDLCILEYVLEHVPDSTLLKKEFHRVLKDNGYVYATVPFMQSYHANPDDYYRFTISGFPKVFNKFKKIECGPFGGPASALCNAIKEFLAILFSFNSKFLYAIFSQLFILFVFPFKYLDLFLVKSKNAHNFSFSLYFIGQKNDR